MAKKMENQSQWDKICTGDLHHPQKDVPTSNLERREDPSSREREIFGTTSRSQTELEKTYIHQAKTTWNSTEQDVLDARQQVAAVESKLLLYKAILKPI